MPAKNIFALLLVLVFSTLAYAAVPTVTSISHPEGGWSSDSSPTFRINYSGADGYSYEFDSEPSTIPDTIIDTPTSPIFPGIRKDGIHYFHVRAHNTSGWSETTHYQIKIDSKGPTKPMGVKAEAQVDGKILLTWEPSTDEPSGLAFYNVYRSTLRFVYDPALGYNRDFAIRDAVAKKIGSKVTGTTFIDTNFYAEDPHRFHYRIQAVDNAGNLESVSSIASVQTISSCGLDILLETELADGNISISVNSDAEFRRGKILVDAPGAEVQTIKSAITGVKSTSAGYSLAGKPNGDYNVSFYAEDDDGDICSAEQIFYFDTTAPAVSIKSPSPSQELTDSLEFVISASDSGTNPSGIEKVSLLVVYSSGEKLIGDAAKEGNDYVLDWNTLNYENGRFKVIARAFDRGGNKAEDSEVYTISNTFFARVGAAQKIADANSERAKAADYIKGLEEKNVDVNLLRSLLLSADSNYASAVDTYSKGLYYDLAGQSADKAKSSYSTLQSRVSAKQYASANYSYAPGQIDIFLGAAGVTENLKPEAKSMIALLSPTRRLEILEIKSDVNTYYIANIILTVSNHDRNSVSFQLAEPVPKKFEDDASGIVSSSEFKILQKDPVILFGPYDLKFDASKQIVYGLAARLTKAQADALISGKVMDFYVSPPILLSPESDASPLGSSPLLDIGLPQIDLGDNALLLGIAGLFIFGALFVIALLGIVGFYYFVIRKRKK